MSIIFEDIRVDTAAVASQISKAMCGTANLAMFFLKCRVLQF